MARPLLNIRAHAKFKGAQHHDSNDSAFGFYILNSHPSYCRIPLRNCLGSPTGKPQALPMHCHVAKISASNSGVFIFNKNPGAAASQYT